MNKSTSSESSESIDIHFKTHIISLNAADIYDVSITLISNQPLSDNMITSVKYANDNSALKSSMNSINDFVIGSPLYMT